MNTQSTAVSVIVGRMTKDRPWGSFRWAALASGEVYPHTTIPPHDRYSKPLYLTEKPIIVSLCQERKWGRTKKLHLGATRAVLVLVLAIPPHISSAAKSTRHLLYFPDWTSSITPHRNYF